MEWSISIVLPSALVVCYILSANIASPLLIEDNFCLIGLYFSFFKSYPSSSQLLLWPRWDPSESPDVVWSWEDKCLCVLLCHMFQSTSNRTSQARPNYMSAVTSGKCPNSLYPSHPNSKHLPVVLHTHAVLHVPKYTHF